jgi:preprotein translocase subunit YajC
MPMVLLVMVLGMITVVLIAVVLIAGVMIAMLRPSKRRAGKDHQQQCDCKNLLHGENVPRSRGQW